MNSKSTKLTEMASVIVDDRYEITLDELCIACQVDHVAIEELVDEGVVEPTSRNEKPWRFKGEMLPEAVRAFRLQRDLRLNTAGVAVALDLLNEIEVLRKRVGRLEAGVEKIYD